MREIKLYTPDKRSFISFNDPRFLAGEISGLGNNFSITYKDTPKGKVKTNVKPEFEPISLTVYFNVDGSNGYRNYKFLMDFLSQMAGDVFPLEYNDGIKRKFCDVILKTAPKSQISEDGIFSETFTFERQYYWYEEKEETFALKSTDASKVTFPLPFPFGFTGVSFVNKYTIKNVFYEAAPIKIIIKGPVERAPIIVSLKDANNVETISEISINQNCGDGEMFVIDASTKKISRYINDAFVENAYNLTDKRKQSFLYLPLGIYTISSNIQMADAGEIEIAIKHYLLN